MKSDHSGHHEPGKMKKSSDEHRNHHEHGHNHHRMMIADFKRRFWVSMILTIPVLLLSPMIQSWLGLDWAFSGDKYLMFGLSSIIYFYGGYPFLKGLSDELGKDHPE